MDRYRYLLIRNNRNYPGGVRVRIEQSEAAHRLYQGRIASARGRWLASHIDDDPPSHGASDQGVEYQRQLAEAY